MPCLPLQLLLLLLPEAANSDDTEAAGQQQQALGTMHRNAVQELCDHTLADNVKEAAHFLSSLPAATLAHAVLPVLKTQSHVVTQEDASSEAAESESMSSSTAYTACAAGTWYDLSSLSSKEQTEVCQMVLSYLPHMTPQQVSKLLLWGCLGQPHPLLPSGPQLPSSALSEQLKLSLVQAGLAQLKQQSAEQDVMAIDSRLEAEAQRLAVVCDLQQSCNLNRKQQACVQDALSNLSATGTVDSKAEAVDRCITSLITSGCQQSDVLHVASAMLSMLGSNLGQATERFNQQGADKIQTIVFARLSESLQAIAAAELDTPAAEGKSHTASGKLLRFEQQEDDQPEHEQAADFILGLLLSLQQSGKAGTAQQLVSSLRAQVWQKLQQHLLPTDTCTDTDSLNPMEVQLLEAMLNLADSGLAPAESLEVADDTAKMNGAHVAIPKPGVRWQGWGGLEGGGRGVAQAQQVLLLSRSKALIQSGWPKAVVRPADVTSLEAAESLFMQLLTDSTDGQQLKLLQQLLADVWQSGRGNNMKEVSS